MRNNFEPCLVSRSLLAVKTGEKKIRNKKNIKRTHVKTWCHREMLTVINIQRRDKCEVFSRIDDTSGEIWVVSTQRHIKCGDGLEKQLVPRTIYAIISPRDTNNQRKQCGFDVASKSAPWQDFSRVGYQVIEVVSHNIIIAMMILLFSKNSKQMRRQTEIFCFVLFPPAIPRGISRIINRSWTDPRLYSR